MPYVLDVIVILIIIVTAVLGYRHGFVRTMLQLISGVAAFFLAFSLSALVANFTFDNLIQQPIHNRIESAWTETVADGAAHTLAEKAESVRAALPSFIQTMVDTDTLTDGIRHSIGNGDTAASVADYLTTDLLRPIVVGLLRILAFLLLFIVSFYLLRLLGKLIQPLVKLPLIRQTDKLLGTSLGLAKGALFALIAVTAFQLIAAGSTEGFFSIQTIRDSLVVNWIAEHNPIMSIL